MDLRTGRVSQSLALFALLAVGGCAGEHSDSGDRTETTDSAKRPDGGGRRDGGKSNADAGKPAKKDAGKDAAKGVDEDDDEGGDDEATDEDAGETSEDGAVDVPPEPERPACELIRGSSDGASGRMRPEVQVVAENLEVPWGIAWLPNGDMLVTERPGRLRRISGGRLESSALLEVDIAEVNIFESVQLGFEGGLLGIVLHPEFEENRLFFMYYTARSAGGAMVNRLSRYEMSEDGRSAALDRVLLDNIPGGVHHQGGRMMAGPDGKLYLGVGAYTPSLAQNKTALPGKLLRLNWDGSVPDDNPTPGSPVYLSGVRNTQGYDWFDDKHLLLMDHGPTTIDPGVPEKGLDEFNVVRAGQNLGWPNNLGCATRNGITEPVMVWERSFPPGGAAMYRGTEIPEWTGSFFVATLGLPNLGQGEHLHRIQVNPDNPYEVQEHEVYLKGQYGRLRTVAMGPDGYIYITTSNCDSRGTPNGRCANGGDKILRIVAAR